MKQLVRYPILSLLFASLLCFVLALWLQTPAQQAPDIAETAKRLEQKIQTAEQELDAIFNNAGFLLQATENDLSEDSIKKYQDVPYTLFIYNEYDSLIYWNNNKVLPYPSDVKYVTERISELYKIRGSEYLKVQQPYDVALNGQRKSYSLVGLIPIYARYPIQNDYLQDRFPLMSDDFSSYLTLSEKPTSYPIHDRTGNPLTYLTLIEKAAYPHYPLVYWVYLLYLLSSVCLIAAVHVAVYRQWVRPGHPFRALAAFSGFLFLFRGFTYWMGFPEIGKYIYIFNVIFNEEQFFWFDSIGDWLLDIGLLLWWSIFLHQSFRFYPGAATTPRSVQVFWGIAAYGTVALGIAFGQFILDDLVVHSDISVEFSDFASIDRYSMMALLGVVLQCISIFLLTHRFFSILHRFQLPHRSRLLLLSLSIFLVLLPTLLLHPSFRGGLIVVLATALYSLLMYFFVRLQYGSIIWMNVWLMFFSIFITMNIEECTHERNIRLREAFAKKVAHERDERMETISKKIESDLLQDTYFKIYFSSAYIPSRYVIERISYRYLDNNFFGYYNYQISIFNRDNELSAFLGQWREYEAYQSILQSQYTEPTSSPYLHFYSNPDGAFSYIAVYPIRERDNLLGTIIIEFTPKNDVQQSNIYVELLSLPRSRTDEIFREFSYALYKNGRMVVSRGGNFSATFQEDVSTLCAKGESRLLADKEGLYYLVYHAPNDYVTVVNVPTEEFWKPISIFSYIYCISIFLLILIILFNGLIERLTGWQPIVFSFEDSLRERIQRGIIIVSLTSFVTVGFISILYFRAEYSEYHRVRLMRRVESTVKTAAWQIRENPNTLMGSTLVQALANIHNIDINLYDLSGNLISSSETAVFDRQLLGSQMNPLAYYKLRDGQNEVIQNEVINNFEYLAAYVPLKNRNQETIAYLYLPYDLAVDNVARLRDVANFLSALLNVYVIFLLIAGAVAFLIANSITSPLSVISDKLNRLKLGARNEPIEWKNNDEIGELVRQYNRMIEELEESAQQLKRSQRETAWREMAKQVAHEIKNPLTPMKLNIQMLQRVANSDPEKAKQMTTRIANALIEQIDTLARIASEFSNFAKMPAPENEVFSLNDVVSNVHQLFVEEANMQLRLQLPNTDCRVFADKNQILRVLTNLVKNAIQAIPVGKQGLIDIALSVENMVAKVEVRDNGCGIPQERHADIFVPSFTTKTFGSGIGLSMSKSIIESAHGRIYFQSEENVGTSFFMELPLVEGAR